MSSYLKDKLDLKLDFNPRRTQSASALDRPVNGQGHSPKTPKEMPERPIKSADTKKVISESSLCLYSFWVFILSKF